MGSEHGEGEELRTKYMAESQVDEPISLVSHHQCCKT